MRSFIVAAALLCLSFPAPAVVAGVPGKGANAPVEITAQHSLEWDRKAKTYTARKDALAKQGDFSIAADVLTAHYRDEKSASDIAELVAQGGVVIRSPPYTAYGGHAVYDVKTGNAKLTGDGLRIETPSEKLTAQDSIEFFGRDNRLVATGCATAVRATDTLAASTLSAIFAEDAQGRLALKKMNAQGNVVIKTLRETVHGDRGEYDAVTQKAVLTGKVRIYQGENRLEGTRAEVDLRTGLSQLFAPEGGGRVKGVFYPKSGDSQ